MSYINEGANMDLCIEFNKIRTDILKDKVDFRTAIIAKDYKTARYAAMRINKKCEDFNKKLDDIDMTKTEAVIGSAAKVSYDTGLVILALYASMEAAIKAVEVANDHVFTKSEKKEVKKIAKNAMFGKQLAFKTGSMLAGGALESAIRVIANVNNKLNSDNKVDPKDLNAYYVTIKQKMKVVTAKSKLLLNEVDRLENRYGAEEKKKELDKELKDSRDIFKESEGYSMSNYFAEISAEDIQRENIVFEYTYENESGVYVTESFKDIISPLSSIKEKIKNIKENKPNEYDKVKDIADFLDTHEKDIKKAAELIEAEPTKLRKADINMLIRFCLEVIGMFAGLGMVAAFELSNPVGLAIGVAMFIGSYFLMIVDAIVTLIVRYIRANDDVEVLRNLSKIKNALVKIEKKKLPDKYKKKISSTITKISDAEEEGYSKLKVSKESVDVDMLSIYEACQNGLISEDVKESLIASLKRERATRSIMEESSCTEPMDATLREKFQEVKRLVYEKCANGEIPVDAREDILNRAYNKIFNETEVANPPAGSSATPKVQPLDTKKDEAEAKKDLDEMNKNIEKDLGK